MFAKLKVLAAMGALNEFTVKELASTAGVSEPTARTVLDRNRDLVQDVGSIPTGKRGGQITRYALRDEAARMRLAEMLGGVYSEVLAIRAKGPGALSALAPEIREAASETVATLPDVPPMLSLESLESILGRLESTEEVLAVKDRNSLMELARVDLARATGELSEFRDDGRESGYRVRLSNAKRRLDEIGAMTRVGEAAAKREVKPVWWQDPTAPAPFTAATHGFGGAFQAYEPRYIYGPMTDNTAHSAPTRAKIVLVDMTKDQLSGFGRLLTDACERILQRQKYFAPEYLVGQVSQIEILSFDPTDDAGVRMDSLVRDAVVAGAKGIVIVVDSGIAESTASLMACVDVVSRIHKRAVIFDASYNASMRNNVLSHAMMYEPSVADLKEQSVEGLLRTVFDYLTPGSPTKVVASSVDVDDTKAKSFPSFLRGGS